MANPLRRGALGQVSAWQPSSSEFTPRAQTSTYVPHGLRIRQTITSSGSVTIPAGIEWVYAVLAGGGQSSGSSYGGQAGEVVWGWTLAQNTCIIGAGGSGYSRYGHLIARGGGSNSTHFYGIPGGANRTDNTNLDGGPGGRAGRAGSANDGRVTGMNGGDGISGGGGSGAFSVTGTGKTITGGTGGSGLAGGGGGQGIWVTGNTAVGGTGGNGMGPDGTIYTGGGSYSSNIGDVLSGGGAGIGGNGVTRTVSVLGNGGLGGGGAGNGGTGGAGMLYLFY